MKRREKPMRQWLVGVLCALALVVAIPAARAATPKLNGGSTPETAAAIPSCDVNYVATVTPELATQYYAFTAAQNGYYTVTCKNTSLDSYRGTLTLIDAATGEPVDSTLLLSQVPAKLSKKVKKGAAYIVQVDTRSTSGNFKLQLVCVGDGYGDTKAEAAALTLGKTYNTNIAACGDQDWFQFTAPQTNAYTLNLKSTGFAGMLRLNLYDAYGESLGGLTAMSQEMQDSVLIRLEKGETYYVQANGIVGSGKYAFSVNNTNAKPLTAGTVASKSFTADCQQYWFAYTPEYSGTYQVAVKSATCDGMNFTMYDQSGKYVTEAEDYIEKGTSTVLSVPMTKGKMYYFAADAYDPSGTFTVNIRSSAIPCTALNINKTSANIVKGSTVSLTIIRQPAGSLQSITWTSSNTKAATVKNGKVTGMSYGKTTISATTKSGAKATCAVTVQPAKAKFTTVKKSSAGKAGLKWNRVSGASGYEIYRSTSAAGTFSKVRTLSGNAATNCINTATKGKTYYYRVRAYAVVDGSTIYGSFSTTKKVAL